MKKVVKWIGVVLGSLVGLIILLLIVLYFVGNARMTKMYAIQPEAVTIPTDAAAIEQGQRWASSLGCTGCHGEDLSGEVMIDDSTLGYIPTPNLTPGEGGAGSEFTDADWVLAIRHGIDPHEGRALLAMPSANFYYLTDKDLGNVIAYLKTVPPVDNDLGEIRLTFMTKVLLAAGAFGETALPAESIDHTGPRPSAVNAGATVEYGGYLVRIIGCRDCHGAELAGGKNPEPGAPPGPNITLGGGFGGWSQDTFVTAMRTNQNKGMPWEDYARMSDHELDAIYQYIQSLPALENALK
jgi:mono/diheme cytochrome c family protein